MRSAAHGSTNCTCSTKHHLLGCCMYTCWPRGLPSSSLPDFQSPTMSIFLANFLAIPLWGSPTLETNLYITNNADWEVHDEVRSRAPKRLCITNQGNTKGQQNLLYLLWRRRRAFCATAETGKQVFGDKSPQTSIPSAPSISQSVSLISSISERQ